MKHQMRFLDKFPGYDICRQPNSPYKNNYSICRPSDLAGENYNAVSIAFFQGVHNILTQSPEEVQSPEVGQPTVSPLEQMHNRIDRVIRED